MDINNKNEMQTLQGKDLRQMQKVNLVLKEHTTKNKHCHQ